MTINPTATVTLSGGSLMAGHINWVAGQPPSGPGIYDYGLISLSGSNTIAGDVWIQGTGSASVYAGNGSSTTFLGAVLVNPNNTGTTLPVLEADTGGQLVYSGTLQGPAHLTGSGIQIVNGLLAGNITNDSTLDLAPVESCTYGGDICGGGSLIKDGPCCLTLSGSNTCGGGTTVDAGMLTVTTGGAISDEGLTIAAGGMFVFDPSAVANGDMLAAGREGDSPIFVEQKSGQSPQGLAAVPEPGTWALLIAALWSAAIYCRFWRRKGARG
jgi:autotransporter-associated beta strand protein